MPYLCANTVRILERICAIPSFIAIFTPEETIIAFLKPDHKGLMKIKDAHLAFKRREYYLASHPLPDRPLWFQYGDPHAAHHLFLPLFFAS